MSHQVAERLSVDEQKNLSEYEKSLQRMEKGRNYLESLTLYIWKSPLNLTPYISFNQARKY